MSNRHLPRAIASRGKTAVEIERENFEKSQVKYTPEVEFCLHLAIHKFRLHSVV
jgi:DNA-binding XRE family transcriptional regulator